MINLEDILINGYFYFMLLIFLALIGLIVINAKRIIKQFKNIKTTTWITVLLIFLLGLIIRMFFIPHMHQVFYDEFYHINIAGNMDKEQKFCSNLINESYCKIIGWPPGYHFLLSFVFKVFGISEDVAYFFNVFFSSISLLLIFLLTYLVFKNDKIALLSMLMLDFLPVHLKISGSAALMPLSFFFMTLSMIFFLIYLREKKFTLLVLFLTSLLFMIYIRPENFILIFLFSMFIFFYNKKSLKNKRIIITLIIFILLLIPLSFQIYNGLNNKTPYWNESIVSFFDFFKQNVWYNILFWFENKINPLFYTLFAIFGLFSFKRITKKIKYFLLIWFIAFFIFYTCFEKGDMSIRLTLDSWRYSLPLYVPIILFAGNGCYELITTFDKNAFKLLLALIMVLLVVFNYFYFYSFIYLENNHQKEYKNFKISLSKLLQTRSYCNNSNNLTNCYDITIFSD